MAIMLQVVRLAETKGIRMFLGDAEWDWKTRKNVSPWVCRVDGKDRSFQDNAEVLKFVRSYAAPVAAVSCASPAAVVEDVSFPGVDTGLDAGASECFIDEDAAPDTERSPVFVQYDEVMNAPVGVCESVEDLDLVMAESERAA